MFINGDYMAQTAAHEPLGQYWESLDPLNRWGGRFDVQSLREEHMMQLYNKAIAALLTGVIGVVGQFVDLTWATPELIAAATSIRWARSFTS